MGMNLGMFGIMQGATSMWSMRSCDLMIVEERMVWIWESCPSRWIACGIAIWKGNSAHLFHVLIWKELPVFIDDWSKGVVEYHGNRQPDAASCIIFCFIDLPKGHYQYHTQHCLWLIGLCPKGHIQSQWCKILGPIPSCDLASGRTDWWKLGWVACTCMILRIAWGPL